MTIEELIEQEMEAYSEGDYAKFSHTRERITAFAALVAAAERKACAKVCDELPAPDIYNDSDKSMWEVTCTDCGDAIRARGETK